MIYRGLELFGVVPNTRCTPKPETALKESNVTQYKLSISDDGKGFREIAQGKWKADAQMKIADFPACSGRYLKFEILAANGKQAIINEIEIASATTPPKGQSGIVSKKSSSDKVDISAENEDALSNE